MLSQNATSWLAGGLLLACIFLFRVGFLPRRRGDTPFCRKCRYNLTGVAIDTAESRCPECGVELKAHVPHRGVRPKRVWAKGAFFATLFLAIGFGSLKAAERLGKIRVIEYLPESWLIARVERDTGPEALAALTELRRRAALVGLGKETIARLIETGLRRQAVANAASPQQFSFDYLLIEDLTARLAAGELSAAQAQRFADSALRVVAVRTRTPIPRNRRMLVELELLTRSGQGMELAMLPVRVFVDGKAASPELPKEDDFFFGRMLSLPLFTQTATGEFRVARGPGKVPVSVELEYRVQRGDNVVATAKIVADHELDIASDNSTLAVGAESSPEIDETMSGLFRVAYGERPPFTGSGPSDVQLPPTGYLSISMEARNRANACFQIVVEHAGRRFLTGPTFTRAAAPDPQARGSMSVTFPVPWKPERVFLVPDYDEALERTLYSTIWSRTLRFDTIPTLEQPSGASTHPVGAKGEIDPTGDPAILKTLPRMPNMVSNAVRQPHVPAVKPPPILNDVLLKAVFPILFDRDPKKDAAPASQPQTTTAPAGESVR